MKWLWVFLKNWDSEQSFDLKAGHWWIIRCDTFAVEWIITLAVITGATGEKQHLLYWSERLWNWVFILFITLLISCSRFCHWKQRCLLAAELRGLISLLVTSLCSGCFLQTLQGGLNGVSQHSLAVSSQKCSGISLPLLPFTALPVTIAE